MNIILWGIVGVGIGLGFAVWSYYRLPVRVPKAWLYVLAVLRALGVGGLFFLLGEPLLSRFITREEKPLILLLVDNSQSVFWRQTISFDAYVAGINALRQKLEEVGFRTVLYAFDSKLRPWDSVNGEGRATHLTMSLRRGLEQHPDGVGAILVSDGQENGESAPLPKGIPVWTVGVGPPPIAADPAIDAMELPPWAVEGRSASLQVRFRGITAPASLIISYPGGQQKIALPPGAQTSTLKLPPLSAGFHHLRFLLEAPNDPNPTNNQRSALLDVQPQEARIFLWAGEITPDIAFLRARLERFGRVQVIAARKPTGFTVSPDTLRWGPRDLHVLYNFPLRPEDEAWAERLWRENTFLLMSWGAVDLRESFRQNLGLPSGGALKAHTVPGGITLYVRVGEALPTGIPIDLGWGHPIGYKLYRGNRLYTILLGEGWWRLREAPQTEAVWDSLFLTLIQEGFRLQRTQWLFVPQKNPISLGEAAVWRGILPAKAAFMVGERPIPIRTRPDGLSEAMWLPDSVGVFLYRVMDGEKLLLSGALLVESQTQELQTLGIDSTYLAFIAKATGGQYVPWGQLTTLADSLRKVLPATAFLTSQRLTIPFHEWAVWLVLILSIFSLEWLLRRYVGLY